MYVFMIFWFEVLYGSICLVDELECIYDFCKEGVCIYLVEVFSCLIDGVCYKGGMVNLVNYC